MPCDPDAEERAGEAEGFQAGYYTQSEIDQDYQKLTELITRSADDDTYLINYDDIIRIIVVNEEDLSIQVTVMPDGNISFPLIGSTRAKGKTFAQLEAEITEKLGHFIKDPKVNVYGISFNSAISVLGKVEKPGMYKINTESRISDAITLAGGFAVFRDADTGIIREMANLTEAYIARGESVLPVNFQALFRKGDVRFNIRLQPGDFIYIPSTVDKRVMVVGEVNRPGRLPFEDGLTLMEALAASGDLTSDAKYGMYLVRGAIYRPEVRKIDYHDIVKGRDKDIVLRPGDIVYVPEKLISKIEYVAIKLTPIMNAINQSQTVIERRRVYKLGGQGAR